MNGGGSIKMNTPNVNFNTPSIKPVAVNVQMPSMKVPEVKVGLPSLKAELPTVSYTGVNSVNVG